jgi:hypothetical protein
MIAQKQIRIKMKQAKQKENDEDGFACGAIMNEAFERGCWINEDFVIPTNVKRFEYTVSKHVHLNFVLYRFCFMLSLTCTSGYSIRAREGRKHLVVNVKRRNFRNFLFLPIILSGRE